MCTFRKSLLAISLPSVQRETSPLHWLSTGLALVACLASLPVLGAPEPAPTPPIPLQEAAQIFKEASQISERDGGQLWGVSLYGPMLLIEPDSRFLVANQADTAGQLKPQAEVFTGTMPASEQFANTAATWSGVYWTEIMWPLPRDPASRSTLIAHELFHRIRDQLHLPPLQITENGQLDTLQGRYLLQLEWRALSRALAAPRDVQRREAALDALSFRAQRHRLFPGAAGQEGSLESNEGLAEYTGVKAGAPDTQAQLAAAQDDLAHHAKDASFTRSFAYATGPAYGLLLDRYAPGWRQHWQAGKGFEALLGPALHMSPPKDLAATVAARAAFYDGATLLQSETVRDAERQKRLAQYRSLFLDNPVLLLPITAHIQVQFDPRQVLSFEGHGSVYPTLKASDDWGSLEVEKGAVISSGWHSITVPASPLTEGAPVKGDGWTLQLQPGWRIVAGRRKGDFTVSGPDKVPSTDGTNRAGRTAATPK